MPKIPIEFAYGDYEDAAPSVENRRVLNCYPETTPGKNTKTVVRAIEGFENFSTPAIVDGEFLAAVEVSSDRYFCTNNAGVVTLYKINSVGTVTTIGVMGGFGSTSQAKMVYNGKNIVILSGATVQSNDYYYDINTATLDQITNLDATYAGFQRAKDVVVKDGYYVFSSVDTIYHGDNVTTGSGLTFNALSFQNIPAESGGAGGMEVANSVLYLFTRNKTYFYQVASTTPFSFARSTSQTLDIGSVFRDNHIAVGSDIYLYGQEPTAQTRSFYKLTGSSFTLLRDQEFTTDLTGNIGLLSYQLNSHRFVGIVNTNEIPASEFREQAYFYDDTESQLRGYPIWHRRGFVSVADNQTVVNKYPVLYYSTTFATAEGRPVMAFTVNDEDAKTYIYSVKQNSSLNDATFFTLAGTSETVFEYSFPLLRDNSSPISVRKVSLGFNANVATAELLQSTDGINYVSLGEYDLTTVSSNRAEWRRIGRFETDVVFKVRLTSVTSDDPIAIIDGFYEV